ncbi:glutathione S-transferase [Aspergillus desertorum]
MTVASDITLYTDNTPNGAKAPIILEELGLPYKLEHLSIQSGKQKEEWYLKINPNGQIPAITDGKQRVFDSGAILLYLTQKYDTENKVSYPVGTPEYFETLSWISWQIGGLGPKAGQALAFAAFAPVRSDYAIEKFLNETKNLFGVLEYRLKESPYLAGDKYTIADIASFPWVFQGADALDLDLNEWPHVKAWVEKIIQRPAVQKGLTTPTPPFTAEQFKEFCRAQRAAVLAKENTDKH